MWLMRNSTIELKEVGEVGMIKVVMRIMLLSEYGPLLDAMVYGGTYSNNLTAMIQIYEYLILLA